jgi:hypothetical protein
MQTNVLRKVIVACVVACLLALVAAAQDYKSLLGKWNMTSETDGDPVYWTLILKEVDGKLAASLATASGEQPAKDFSYKDGVIKFQAPYQGEYYDIELKIQDGKLDGSWSGNGNSGRTSGVKAAE